VDFKVTKLAILALSVVVLACGEINTPVESVSNPTSPDSGIDNARPAGPRSAGRIVFGSSTARPKIAATADWSGVQAYDTDESSIAFGEGGELAATFNAYGTDATVRVDAVRFVVQPNSIGGIEPAWGDVHRIEMSAQSGQRLEDILIGFQPSGMTFSPAATLNIRGSGHINPKDLVMYHISDDGEVTLPSFWVKASGSHWAIVIGVPGFSEYSMDEEGQEGDEG
jgi:hypothetical protein